MTRDRRSTATRLVVAAVPLAFLAVFFAIPVGSILARGISDGSVALQCPFGSPPKMETNSRSFGSPSTPVTNSCSSRSGISFGTAKETGRTSLR